MNEYINHYFELKEYISDIINGEIDEYDIEALEEHIQDIKSNGDINQNQYDELIGYLQEL